METHFVRVLMCVSLLSGRFTLAAEEDYQKQLSAAKLMEERADYTAAERTLTHLLKDNTPALTATKRAEALQLLGSVCHWQARYTEAKRYYRNSIEVLRNSPNPDTEQLISSTLSLAALLMETGALAEAERLNLSQLATNGSLRKEVLAVLTGSLASLALVQGRFGEAEWRFRQALRLWDELQGVNVTRVQLVNNLATLFVRTHRYGEAIRSYETALALAEVSPGPTHPMNIVLLANTAAARLEAEGADAAVRTYQRAIALAEATGRTSHPVMGVVLWGYARALRKLKRTGEAKPCERRARTILQDAHAVDTRKYQVHVSEIRSRNEDGDGPDVSNHESGRSPDAAFDFQVVGYTVHMRVSFPERGGPKMLTAYTEAGRPSQDCSSVDYRSSRCGDKFFGSVAAVDFRVFSAEGASTIAAAIRTETTVLDQSPGMPKRASFTSVVPIRDGAGRDLHSFGYDERLVPEAARASRRESAKSAWMHCRQQFSLEGQREPFATVEWLHTTNGIRIVRVEPNSPLRSPPS